MNEIDVPVVRMRRPRWGNPQTPGALPGIAATALEQLGARSSAAVDPGDVSLPDSALPAAAREAIVSVVGAKYVAAEHDARVQHTRGYSTPDILKLRAGDGTDAPDVVASPGDHDEVVGLLRVCSEHRIAVVPFGGGTSVVGGLTPVRDGFAGVIALDLHRLDQLVHLDEVSRTATLQSGMRGPQAEELLHAKGFTLGHFPQSYEGATIGGYAAARSAGQSSAGYGRFDEMVVGLVLATPRGTVELGTAPMSAAGPDLRQLVLGSEGAFGVITSVTVQVRPVPRHRVFEGWRFESFGAGAEALRALAQDGPLPTVLRLSDEAETAVNLADPSGKLGGSTGGCLVVTGYEGAPGEVEARRAAATEVLAAAGGTALGTEVGEAWREGRFRGPYLRDPMLDAGGLVETLETATFWSNLANLKTAVTQSITEALAGQGTPPLVLCHISHVYAAGASLYFTVICAQSGDPLEQWAQAKHAANEAIRSSGATITHHHGVGTDHREAYHAEIGPLAVRAVRAVKDSLDPKGVLNPGVLI
ncbi:FAD-binding oxidoreductase [Amycolatopsis palatopharyngis]|uniref:FAD-binding oxidoreductase n=1 Tax=Amycolatopsis palatopharyngis TaxID=187982 RepID=UPI001FE3F86E|nr:FAD-binding oxidoreductase [Amycolatopsis palatopharyngis]